MVVRNVSKGNLYVKKTMKKTNKKGKYRNNPIIETKTNRNRVVAALLAIFLGGIGVHKFYLGKAGWGIIYFIFSWSFLPAIIGFFEGIVYLFMTDKEFESKYS